MLLFTKRKTTIKKPSKYEFSKTIHHKISIISINGRVLVKLKSLTIKKTSKNYTFFFTKFFKNGFESTTNAYVIVR